MFIILIRTAILYILVVFSIRIMGKRQIGQLEPFELVIAIMISDLASLPMSDTRIPLLHGIIPIVTLLMLQIILSLLQLKSEKLKTLIDGKSTVLIREGKLQIAQLRNQRLSVSELLEELRIKGYLNIEDIEYAALETNGQLSVLEKSENTPVQKKDMNITPHQESIPIILIAEGKVSHKNLKAAQKDEKWLSNELRKNNIKSVEEIFIGILNSKNQFFYQLKENK